MHGENEKRMDDKLRERMKKFYARVKFWNTFNAQLTNEKVSKFIHSSSRSYAYSWN